MYIPRTSLHTRNPSLYWLCVLVAFFALRCEVMPAAGTQPTARTMQGKVVGKWIVNGTQKAFLGLPYAAPRLGSCVGGLRSPRPHGKAYGTQPGLGHVANSGTSGTTTSFWILALQRIAFI
jgi:hypothetical protein